MSALNNVHLTLSRQPRPHRRGFSLPLRPATAEDHTMKCPFIYANGRQCDGTVSHSRAYGKRQQHGVVAEHDIKKIRLWCDQKWDHAGAVSSFEAKDRMEFHPDDLRRQGLYDEALALCENSKRASARLLTFPANRRERSHSPNG
jgi:hypothetical protein